MAIGDIISENNTSGVRNTMEHILNGTGSALGGPYQVPIPNYHQGGYNQGLTVLEYPYADGIIASSYLDSLYDAAQRISIFYNITNPFTDSDRSGQLIRWSDLASKAEQFDTDIKARWNAPWDYSTGWDISVQNELTDSISNWNGEQIQMVKISFGSQANQDAWFACGGEIRLSMSHNDTSGNQQGTSWEQLTADVGTYLISVKQQGDGSTNLKYISLPTYVSPNFGGILIHTATDSDYSLNKIYIYGRRETNGDIYIKTTLDDAHVARSGSGSGYGGAWSWTGADTVPGTTTLYVDSLRMANSSGSMVITNPTFTITDSL